MRTDNSASVNNFIEQIATILRGAVIDRDLAPEDMCTQQLESLSASFGKIAEMARENARYFRSEAKACWY